MGDGVSYADSKKNKVSEHRSVLRPSEKELLERRSDAFRHKVPPLIDGLVYSDFNILYHHWSSGL
jgi:hypothetical protein